MAGDDEGSIVGSIIQKLSSMEPETRKRTLAAAQAYFGNYEQAAPSLLRDAPSIAGIPSPDMTSLPAKAQLWMRQCNLTTEDIEKVFHIEGGAVEIIAATIPGKSKKEQTFNAYNLLGAAKLLSTGAPSFDDKDARELCISQGCYDGANHATHFRHKSSDLAGSKEKGWTLTAPGLKNVAALIKDIATSH